MRRSPVDSFPEDPARTAVPESHEGQKAEHGSQQRQMRQEKGDGCGRSREVEPVCNHQHEAGAENAGTGGDMKNEQAMAPPPGG
jgi:hypothetical protein